MDWMLFSGVFALPWWGDVIVALVLTHITIVSVTVFLHRHQAHRALDLHPAVSHFFRLWLWLTTGMATKEWAAIHRKHHAKCETAEDPHSPQVLGINRVLWGGVFLYVTATSDRASIERYGHGTPDDSLERNVYSKFRILGLTLMGVSEVVLFGIVPGVLILLTQIIWIPFWAAGVINGIGHYWGYRHWSTPDASKNIAPWGIVIGGEELHNNHHAYPTSAKFSRKWYELDIGWLYIRFLVNLGLAKVKHIAPTPHFTAPKAIADVQMLQAVIANRYEVLASYAAFLRRTYLQEKGALRRGVLKNSRILQILMHEPVGGETTLPETERKAFAEVLARSRALQTPYAMRRELMTLWARSAATSEQLVRQLQDWCQRAEASGIRPLVEFSQRLRRYA